MVTIDINVTLLWQMANFLILLFALNFLLFKPIRGIIKERAEKIASMKGEIKANEEGAKNKTEELEAQRTEARKAGAQAKEEIKAEGRGQEREIIDAATAEMEASVAKVREEIAGEIGQARDELKSQVQNFGVDLAEKILGRSIQ
jgi:F-type H+-transporting ATPase subunit b